MSLMRFYLYVLKGSGYLLMRMGRVDEALERLEKLVALDTSDRIGAQALVELARNALDRSGAVSV
jgi:DNA-binding SARP family transcriptional activator